MIPPRGNTGPTPDYTFATTFSYFATTDASKRAGLLQSVTGPAVAENAAGNKTTYDYL